MSTNDLDPHVDVSYIDLINGPIINFNVDRANLMISFVYSWK